MEATFTMLFRELLIERRDLYQKLAEEAEKESFAAAMKWTILRDHCTELIEDVESEKPE